ncbi:MAG: selenocysteine-specific translation elongation factor [Firmicutes bacterium]|nr:selenocysteine-specific translation elongation factor [Bacillota bacterium]
MKHFIIGTAGHVDHGKTVLVEKLTGTNTDRLKEEQDRGISIELGFTSITLNSGQMASIIDVPGHERFIKNMLAGVGGIDMVMLVIAADEGVMPQTREHLDIIQLLQINKGLVVITKIDTVDEELLELVEEDVRDFVSQTVLADAPVVKVSAVAGQGMDELKETLTQIAETVPIREESGFPRLPVDRVFSVTGFGTVVTGTLISGYLDVGQNVEIYPQSITSRVRSIQVHGDKQDRAGAGQRVAVNITGIETGEVRRGNVIAGPGSLKPWNRIDVKLHLLKSSPRPLKTRTRVRVYLGTEEILSRIILLDRDELQPGEDCYAQLMLEKLAVCAKNDRFVIRSYSPMLTIGGGKIIDPCARKHKRFKPDVIESLKMREKGTPSELTEQFLTIHKTILAGEEIEPLLDMNTHQREEVLAGLITNNKVKSIQGNPTLYAATDNYHHWTEEIIRLVEAYQRQYPLREGFPKEELRSRKFPKLSSKQFQQLMLAMENDGYIKIYAQVISMPHFNPQPNDNQRKIIDEFVRTFEHAGFQPPNWPDICARLKTDENQANEILQYLLKIGTLVKIADNIFFHRHALDKAHSTIREYLQQHGEISIGGARDALQTSRKYTLPLLEYFDKKKITRRVGDMRVAGKAME